MSKSTSADGSEPASIWRFEPLSSFRPPPASVSESARTGLRWLFQRLVERTASEPNQEDSELPGLGPDELEKLVPTLPLDRIGEALALALPGWPEGPGASKLRVVVDPPPGPGIELTQTLARTLRLPIVEPPAPDVLLGGAESVLRALENRADEPLAMLHLERWFLRESHALRILRDLLAALALRRAPTLVSCGSWAWAWLRAALQVDALLPDPLALAPLDAGALATWLAAPADGRLVCREPDGKWLLPPEGGEVEGESSDFLHHLAAEAGGNPIVARALWGRALRRPPDGTFDGVDLPVGVTGLAALPWTQLARPGLDRRPRFEEVAVLHTLLLHGGLSTDVLTRILPFGEADVSRCLAGLSAARLIDLETNAWRVSPAGYPAVRGELIAAGLPASDV